MYAIRSYYARSRPIMQTVVIKYDWRWRHYQIDRTATLDKIRLSNRIQRIKPSPTLAITAHVAELRASGKDIIGLGAGEPDFNTPEYIRRITSYNVCYTKLLLRGKVGTLLSRALRRVACHQDRPAGENHVHPRGGLLHPPRQACHQDGLV